MVVFPLPVGPHISTMPDGLLMALTIKERCRSGIPRSARVKRLAFWFSTRIDSFSPFSAPALATRKATVLAALLRA